jgi:hypothetical protein
MRWTSVTPWSSPACPFDCEGINSQATAPASGDAAFFALGASPLAPLPSFSVHDGPAPCFPARSPPGSAARKSSASGATSFHSAAPAEVA